MTTWWVRALAVVAALAMGCGPDSSSSADAGGGDGSAAAPDTDGDGISDADEGRDDDGGPRDTDDDGIPDFEDTDSDGDGVSDADEAGDADPGTPPRDTDADGTPDFEDTDSDGDGIPDSFEGDGLPDTDGDGAPDLIDPDSDNDGILDGTEAAGDPPVDTDGDGIPDFRDLDSDGDSVPDADEGIDDYDGDGVPNATDPVNDGDPSPIELTAISTEFNQPIGIDYHEPTDSVVMSVNYPEGNPLNFERIEFDGTHEAFSDFAGMTEEVKIATARSGNPSGFVAGDLFVGNGVDGQIARITDGGATVINPWVDLPGDNNGLMRGSLYVDRTGLYDGHLIAVTTAGQVWRIDSTGVPTLIASVGVHLEGCIVVPDAPARFGPLAGRIIAGAENESLLHAFTADGTMVTYNVGVAIEDIDIASPRENFFGVNFGTSRLLGAPADQFHSVMGDVILTQESHTGVGLYRLKWTGTDFVSQEIPATATSAAIGQWEHVTFAPAGIVEVPPID